MDAYNIKIVYLSFLININVINLVASHHSLLHVFQFYMSCSLGRDSYNPSLKDFVIPEVNTVLLE